MKHGDVSLAPHCVRSQTPSGPLASWHWRPDSMQIVGRPGLLEIESQPVDASMNPSRSAEDIVVVRTCDRPPQRRLKARSSLVGSGSEVSGFTLSSVYQNPLSATP